MGSTTEPSLPGVMIVHPRLRDATERNEGMLIRWMKMHFRDLVNVPSDGGIPLASMFVADGEGRDVSRFFNVIHAPNIDVFRSPEYYAVSRRLDLENTRALVDSEECVACGEGKMIWDLVDAAFTIYEVVEGGTGSHGVKSFQTRQTSKGKSSLVAVSIDQSDVGQDVARDLVQCLSGNKFDDVHYGLYRNAGVGAQPDMHPFIEKEQVGGTEWLVLVLLGHEHEMSRVGEVEQVVKAWVVESGATFMGAKISYGVWESAVEVA